MSATRTAAESWQLVDEILARPTARRVAGQLAAFPLDDAAPAALDVAPRQLGLFDPEVAE